MVRYVFWGGSITYILIQSSILLRYGFKPYDLTRREAHYEINVVYSLCHLVDIMAKTMTFGEEDLGQMVRLLMFSKCLGEKCGHCTF